MIEFNVSGMRSNKVVAVSAFRHMMSLLDLLEIEEIFK